MWILLYVDDLIVTRSSKQSIAAFENSLRREFPIKNLGQLHYFLGVEVTHGPAGLLLSQHQYAVDILKRAGMENCKPIGTPVATKEPKLQNGTSLASQPSLFRSIVGALQYLTLTRPDLSFAVNRLCQTMHAPTVADFHRLKTVLRYLHGTVSYGMKIHSTSTLNLCGYSDADWGGCAMTRRSTTWYCFFLGANCISWSAKRQPTVSRSSTEAEYRSLAVAAAESTWILFLLRDLNIP